MSPNTEPQRETAIVVVIGTLAQMGGAERQGLYLVEHLVGLRNCVTSVLTFRDGPALRPNLEALGVPIHVVPYDESWTRAARVRGLAAIAMLLRKHHVDAVLPIGSPSSKALGLAFPFTAARFCWWNQQDEGRGLSGTPIERRIITNASCITSNSTAGGDFIATTYQIPGNRILVYNNGTPLPSMAGVTGGWREKLDLGSRPVVTMVANLTSFKDHDTLLEAWPMVRREFPAHATPVLLLAGSVADTRTVKKLKSKAFDLGVSGNDVQFLGAVDDVASLMRECDLIVHSSLLEGCPNAVCEAMALALPVVATDIPGCRQALGNSTPESLVEPSNAGALARAIVLFLKNEGLRKAAGTMNRERIATHFTVSGMNEFFQREIERGLGRPLC